MIACKGDHLAPNTEAPKEVLSQMRLKQRVLGQWIPPIMVGWECKECGFRGPLTIEDGKIADKLREEYTQKQKKTKKEKN